MAQRSGLFDSVAGDRELDTQLWARLNVMLATNGVVLGFADQLRVRQTSPVSKDVEIALGRYWIEGRPYEVHSAAELVTVAAADATNKRIDRVVVRRDLTARQVVWEYLQGTPAVTPAAPALTQDPAGVWQESLAQIHVPANATQIFTNQADAPAGQGWVVDERVFSRDVGTPGLRQVVVFTSSGAFNKADFPWLRTVRPRVQGAGGGGAGAEATGSGQVSGGGGGGGGGYAESLIDVAALAASETVTVGAGGSGGVGLASGSGGGASSFGAHAAADGGLGGGFVGISTPPVISLAGSAGIGTAGGLLIRGGGGSGAALVHATNANGARGGAGGDARFGGGARSVRGSSNGESGGAHGGGGSGAANLQSSTAKTGGAGAPGVVVVELYA